jgi:hypothetical protein
LLQPARHALPGLSLGISGGRVGSLLWPAVVVHAVLALPLARAWLKDQHEDAE